MDQRTEYNIDPSRRSFPPHVESFDSVPHDVEALRFRFDRALQGSLSRFKNLRRLLVFCASQDGLEEISQLPLLNMLFLRQTRADNFDCLRHCRSLRHCVIQSAPKMVSLSWLQNLPGLESVGLRELKRVQDITPVTALRGLKAFGIEGGMTSMQRVNDFMPLAKLDGIEALFLYACRPLSHGLKPLFELKSLRYLEIAGRYPDTEFLELRARLPGLQCSWFEAIDEYGSIKAAIQAKMRSRV